MPPAGAARERSATRLHCITLPSGPACGTALQVPCGKCTCLPATAFPERGLGFGADRSGQENNHANGRADNRHPKHVFVVDIALPRLSRILDANYSQRSK